MTVLAILCAAAAAVCGALGARLQHTGVQSETVGGGLRPRTVGRLLRNRSWMVGTSTLVLCVALQIFALSFAPVVVVAPIVVLSLPIVVALGARTRRVGLGGASGTAVVATTLAVVVFVGLAAHVATGTGIGQDALFDAARVVGLAVAALAVLGALSRGSLRCSAFAAAAGTSYGLVSIMIRDIGYSVRMDGLAGLSPWSLLGAAAAFLAGSWLVQLGYSSGPPDVVVGYYTVFNPLVATATGMTILGEVSGMPPQILGVMLACAAVAVTGVTVLAGRNAGTASQQRASHPALSRGAP